MADIALLAPGVSDAPEGYQVPGAQEIIIKAVTANYDGSSAAGSFIPTLQVIAPNGAILASCPTSTAVVAGASADVSWFPRSGVASGGGGGGSIQFDTDNEGGWLDVTANDADAGGFGIALHDQSHGGSGIDVRSADLVQIGGLAGQGSFLLESFGDLVAASIGSEGGLEINTGVAGGATLGVFIGDHGSGGIILDNTTVGGTGPIEISAAEVLVQQTGGKLSFFGVTPVTQRATPVTLADVISILRAYGLAA